MHDLMGPWGPGHVNNNTNGSTCIGPWCKYVYDMNQEVMMYLPTPSNRGVLLGKPAFDMLPAALNGSWGAIYGSNSAGAGNMWLAAQAWRYCLHHGDDARLLGSVLPIIKNGIADANIKTGADGLLHLYNCSSPEYQFPPGPLRNDCPYGLALLRWAAQTGLAIAEELAPQDPNITTFRDLLARLAPFPVDAATGSWEVAAGYPFDHPHRHYSHLLAIYDLGIAGAAPGEVATMAASVDVWQNVTCSGPQAFGPDFDGDGECRGFTQAVMSAMSALLNRTEAALGNLTSLLALVGLPNAMYGEVRPARTLAQSLARTRPRALALAP